MRGFTANVTDDQVRILAPYHHHVVRIKGKDGVLLTYHWVRDLLAGNDAVPKSVRVITQHARGHPQAPAYVQAVVDNLFFYSADIDL